MQTILVIVKMLINNFKRYKIIKDFSIKNKLKFNFIFLLLLSLIYSILKNLYLIHHKLKNSIFLWVIFYKIIMFAKENRWKIYITLIFFKYYKN